MAVCNRIIHVVETACYSLSFVKSVKDAFRSSPSSSSEIALMTKGKEEANVDDGW